MARFGQTDRKVTRRAVRDTMALMRRLSGDTSVPIPDAKPRAAPVQHERREQEALAAWVRRQWWGELWFHVPNELTPHQNC